MRGRRQRRGSEDVGRDVELFHEILVQAAFDDDGRLRAGGELHDLVRRFRLGCGNRQAAAEGDQVQRILDHVVTETFLVQRAGGEFRVERHGADGFVQGGVLLPDFGCERHGAPCGTTMQRSRGGLKLQDENRKG